ncbi:Abi family protein [Cellulomonas biazotea]|uniref:Abi family protein n=1 Tax=Cellulomonas biazotea TaxID=1709 RepID=A0A402DRW0_9CELL|nr:Abi family protein [Cellulomonas biazotea]GCE76879.1 abi family protein [Cellulomonas biazotea]
MVAYSKPYLTFDEQVDRLEQRGLDLDRGFALDALERIGYYRLSAYWYPYRIPDTSASAALGSPVRSDRVRPGTTLEQVVSLYDFDRRLKLLLMDAIERVEVAVRVQLAHTLGAADAFAHRDAERFAPRFSKPRPGRGGTSAHGEWIGKLSLAQSRSKEDFVAHFTAKYGGDLPIWVAVEVIDFGMTSTLYEYTRTPDRNAIAARHGVVDQNGVGNGAALANWMRVLNLARNTCAHHSRLWNRNFVDQIAPSRVGGMPALRHLSDLSARDQARVYPALAITRYLMDSVALDSSWQRRLVTHLDSFPADSVVSHADMGLPPEWRRYLA